MITLLAGGGKHAWGTPVFMLHILSIFDVFHFKSYNNNGIKLKKAENDMGVEYLGSVKVENFSENKFSDPVVFKRAKHVITENKRVLDAKKYLLENNIEKFGQLMNESHSSY